MEAVARLAERQDGVAGQEQLAALGVSRQAIGRRCRPDGPWQRPVPGVVLLQDAPATARQRCWIALRYAEGGVAGCPHSDAARPLLTGLAALWRYRFHSVHGLAPSADVPVDVLVDARATLPAQPGVRVRRTLQLPRPVLVNGVPCAPVARAVADAVECLPHARAVRALLVEALSSGWSTRAQLRRELPDGLRVPSRVTRGSAGPRCAAGPLVSGRPGSAG